MTHVFDDTTLDRRAALVQPGYHTRLEAIDELRSKARRYIDHKYVGDTKASHNVLELGEDRPFGSQSDCVFTRNFLYINEDGKFCVETLVEVRGDESQAEAIYSEPKVLTWKEALRYVCRYFERFPKVYVNAYAVSREYGGPAEGGDYYDAGEPVATVPVLKKGDNVERVKEMLRESLGELYEQKNGRTRYSVNGGADLEICVEDHPAEAYPKGPYRYE